MNEPYETLDNAIELEQLDHREQAYEAEVHNLVSQLRQLIEHQPDDSLHPCHSIRIPSQPPGGNMETYPEMNREIVSLLRMMPPDTHPVEAYAAARIEELERHNEALAAELAALRDNQSLDEEAHAITVQPNYERAYRALSRDYDALVSEVDLELDEQKDLIARLLENLRQTVDALSYWFPRWGDPKGANSQMMINARCAIAHAEAHLRSSQVEPAVGDEATEAGWTR